MSAIERFHCIQIDGVAMVFPLGLVLANVFMVELEERHLKPSLKQKISLWKRYVDNNFAFVKKDQVEAALLVPSEDQLYL